MELVNRGALVGDARIGFGSDCIVGVRGVIRAVGGLIGSPVRLIREIHIVDCKSEGMLMPCNLQSIQTRVDGNEKLPRGGGRISWGLASNSSFSFSCCENMLAQNKDSKETSDTCSN